MILLNLKNLDTSPGPRNVQEILDSGQLGNGLATDVPLKANLPLMISLCMKVLLWNFDIDFHKVNYHLFVYSRLV